MTVAPFETPTALEAKLAHVLKDVIGDHCINYVAPDDTSKANHVIIGKPTRELRDEIVVSVHMDHPLGPIMDRDDRVSGLRGGLSNRPYVIPNETIGGMTVDEIIGGVQIRARRRETSEDATFIIKPVHVRIKRAINRDKRLRLIQDDLGNTMFTIHTFRAVGYESGGGDVTINTRWVNFRALACYSNCRDL